MERLKLDKGPKVRRNRQRYYEDYKNRKLTLAGLREYAPLVAEVVARWEANGQPLRLRSAVRRERRLLLPVCATGETPPHHPPFLHSQYYNTVDPIVIP